MGGGIEQVRAPDGGKGMVPGVDVFVGGRIGSNSHIAKARCHCLPHPAARRPPPAATAATACAPPRIKRRCMLLTAGVGRRSRSGFRVTVQG